MENESESLAVKTDALHNFLMGERGRDVIGLERVLMWTQHSVMIEYQNILTKRIQFARYETGPE